MALLVAAGPAQGAGTQPALATSSRAVTAHIAVARVRPSQVTSRQLVFRVRMAVRTITSVRLTSRGHSVFLRVKAVRRAVRQGRVAVRRTSWARSSVNTALVIRYTASGVSNVATLPSTSAGAKVKTTTAPISSVTQAASTVACPSALSSVAGGGHAPGCWRPYSDSSPFNLPIKSSAPAIANSDAVVSRMMGFGTPDNLIAGANGGYDGGRPLFFSSATDPVFTLHCTESWGVCPIEGAQVHVPDAAQASQGSDAHLTVIDAVSGWEYDLWTVSSKPKGGGVLSFGWGGKTRIDGNGLGSGAVAAGFGSAAGIIRAEELAAGQINHALFLDVKCDSPQAVYPAGNGGRACSDIGLSNTNAPAMGSRFQLTMSDAQIAALSVPDWKKTILRAMAHYGMIVGDTGGGWGLAMESGVAYTSLGQADQWVSFAKQVGAPYYAPDNDYVFNMRDGVDYAHNLRVVDPCASQGTC